MELSIVLPCLNEARTLQSCIEDALQFIRTRGISGEVIVADNGSTDGSQAIASGAGARVIEIPERGYGNAVSGGIAAAQGTFIIMGDADGSYDFLALDLFLEKLRSGYDLVMGNRFSGGIEKGAMPFLHRYVGNPVLSFIGNLLFRSPAKDFHCGLRAFRAASIRNLNLRTTGMEFASEMVVKSVIRNLRIAEVPIVLSQDGRNRKSHLRTWRDGWRHLRFLLLYNTRWTFLYPGAIVSASGLAGIFLLLPSQRYVFDVHTMLYCAAFILVGFNIILFGILSNVLASTAAIIPESAIARLLRKHHCVEYTLATGIFLFSVGMILTAYALEVWWEHDFGNLDPVVMLRITIPAVTSIALGIEIFFASFFLGVINLLPKKNG